MSRVGSGGGGGEAEQAGALEMTLEEAQGPTELTSPTHRQSRRNPRGEVWIWAGEQALP